MNSSVVLIWHGKRLSFEDQSTAINDFNYNLFAKEIHKFKAGKKIVIVIRSPGGDAEAAFKLASLFRKHCGGYTLLVPRWAKSAATLFALGADKIIMSRFAEFGPLDAQIWDREKEEQISALEVVQAIERLNNEAIKAVDQQMLFWVIRCRKRVETLLPIATHFVAEMLQPLFDKIDTVNYTGMARTLKVAQDYAERLLERKGLDHDTASEIADRLTNSYSEHGYAIDCEEMNRIGLKNVEEAKGNVAQIIEEMAFIESDSTILGPLKKG
jgi:hypothetical protein